MDHTRVNQNVLLNTMGVLLHDNATLLWKFICMVGNPLLVCLPEEVDLS